jgi:hypothetical protein
MATIARTRKRDTWLLEFRGVQGQRRRMTVYAKTAAAARAELLYYLTGEILGAVEGQIRQAAGCRVSRRRRR